MHSGQRNRTFTCTLTIYVYLLITYVIINIHSHLEFFPVHLSFNTGKVVKYLNAKLSTKKIYEKFEEKFLYFKVLYKFFWSYFKENFSLKFEHPQKDTCSTCEELNAKIKSQSLEKNAKNVAVTELIIPKFYKALNTIKKLYQIDKQSVGICTDYIANFLLPQMSIRSNIQKK